MSLRQTIADAIDQSKRQNEIVTLWNHDLGIPVGDQAEAAVEMLTEECDDYAESHGDGCIAYTFWGRDLDGAEWLVHVRVVR